ncbi:MAG: hypothetical protein NTW91_03710 [Verrucomicrobia bacterium]|nr:hypothetical protein [Verrucomicrobiota bacterium]
MKRFLPLLAFILLPLALSACASHLDKKEGYLREAGFRTVKPATPEQIAHFQSLRKGHISHETRNGQTMFMLADERTNTLLVGSETEFQNYQEILYAKSVEPGKKTAQFTKGLENVWNQGWGSVLGSLVPQ